jgi:hypothetical protein
LIVAQGSLLFLVDLTQDLVVSLIEPAIRIAVLLLELRLWWQLTQRLCGRRFRKNRRTLFSKTFPAFPSVFVETVADSQ